MIDYDFLNPQSSILKTQPSILNTQSSILNTEPQPLTPMPSTLKRYSLLLPLIIILIFPLPSLLSSLQTNLINLRLTQNIYNPTQPSDADLFDQLLSQDFNTTNDMTAWWGGYYLLTQTNSFALAQQLWNQSPTFSADILARNSLVAEDKAIGLSAATTAYRLDPSSLKNQHALAEALIQNEAWQEAADRLDEFLLNNPDEATLTAMRGYVEYKRGGSNEKAQELLLRAKSLDPSLIRTYLWLVNFNQTINQYETVVSFALEGLLVAEQAKSLYSFNFEGALVDAYLRLGQLEKIEPLLESGIHAFPDSSWWNLMAGKYYMKQGVFDQAQYYFSMAARDTQDVGILADWGDSFMALGDVENAIITYCKVLAINHTFNRVIDQLNQLGATCP